jgi:hypothetical protein
MDIGWGTLGVYKVKDSLTHQLKEELADIISRIGNMDLLLWR